MKGIHDEERFFLIIPMWKHCQFSNVIHAPIMRDKVHNASVMEYKSFVQKTLSRRHRFLSPKAI